MRKGGTKSLEPTKTSLIFFPWSCSFGEETLSLLFHTSPWVHRIGFMMFTKHRASLILPCGGNQGRARKDNNVVLKFFYRKCQPSCGSWLIQLLSIVAWEISPGFLSRSCTRRGRCEMYTTPHTDERLENSSRKTVWTHFWHKLQLDHLI